MDTAKGKAKSGETGGWFEGPRPITSKKMKVPGSRSARKRFTTKSTKFTAGRRGWIFGFGPRSI
jgi:hypothetical protein